MDVPEVIPVTIPVEPTVAFALLLAHVPPVPSVRVIAAPWQTDAGPPINDGFTLTVTGFVIKQPVPVTVYLITGTPDETPVTTPVDETTVARPAERLLQVPPVVVSLNVVVAPTQTDDAPVIIDGNGLMVTVFVAKQPVLSV